MGTSYKSVAKNDEALTVGETCTSYKSVSRIEMAAVIKLWIE
jgi:hypothetical protein